MKGRSSHVKGTKACKPYERVAATKSRARNVHLEISMPTITILFVDYTYSSDHKIARMLQVFEMRISEYDGMGTGLRIYLYSPDSGSQYV